MASNDEYETVLIDNDTDAHLCAKLLAEEFASNNALSILNQSTAEDIYNEWSWPLLIDVLDKKLSFLTRHSRTNEIAATIIAHDLFTYCEKNPFDATSPPPYDPAVDLHDEMFHRFVQHDFEQELKPNMVLFISAVVTQFKHTGKKLAAQLSTHACKHAKDTKGFRYAFVQTSSAATRHIYSKKMNGKEIAIVDPATWIWKRTDDVLSRPFKDYKGEPVANILVDLSELK
ncbi:unnamed protein product [Rotaria sp. Silwood1]|nr:unnamed protein product [Rotaria sp. Silwood1]CAF3626708.1 unnamed protein product [Rotaria sp. Silwood1]CAF4719024.1 unnamed protein product [Rotaria sp. Silwood1]CAF5002685.1 unnamed protein product [Rotaria sp. Silwood1]